MSRLIGESINLKCFDDKDFRNHNFEEKNILGVRFFNCNFEGTQFNKLTIDNCKFVQCNMTRVDFFDVTLKRVSFLDSNLEEAEFFGANLVGIRQIYSTYTKNCSLYVIPGTLHGPRFIAGCRNFTYEQAIKHWDIRRPQPEYVKAINKYMKQNKVS